MKDNEWLKEEITEILLTSKFYYKELKEKIYNAIDQLDEPNPPNSTGLDLPMIPKFVADLLEEYKAKEPVITFYGFIKTVTNLGFKDYHSEEGKFTGWLTNKNEELLMRAWLNGYEIEQEPKYFVEDNKHTLLCKWESLDGWKVISTIEATEDDIPIEVLDYGLTEQEIKDYDERYWPFRRPVEEMGE